MSSEEEIAVLSAIYAYLASTQRRRKRRETRKGGSWSLASRLDTVTRVIGVA